MSGVSYLSELPSWPRVTPLSCYEGAQALNQRASGHHARPDVLCVWAKSPKRWPVAVTASDGQLREALVRPAGAFCGQEPGVDGCPLVSAGFSFDSTRWEPRHSLAFGPGGGRTRRGCLLWANRLTGAQGRRVRQDAKDGGQPSPRSGSARWRRGPYLTDVAERGRIRCVGRDGSLWRGARVVPAALTDGGPLGGASGPHPATGRGAAPLWVRPTAVARRGPVRA